MTVRNVSAFEARLLRILRVLMGRGQVDQVLAILVRPVKRPPCLSRACVQLVQNYLATGMTEFLARSGWSSEKFLNGERVVTGRLWQRHEIEQMSLEFSAASVELLIWLTAENFVQPKQKLNVDPGALTVGDQLLWTRTWLAVQDTLGGPPLLEQAGFAGLGLLNLLAPGATGLQGGGGEPGVAFWCRPAQAWILESLQAQLSEAWVSVEARKRVNTSHKEVRRIGQHQAAILKELFDAAQGHGRRDLCVFVLRAAAELMNDPAGDWFRAINVQSLKMAERQDVYMAALAFFTGLNRLHEWNQQARSVGFYDEDYESGQFWKSCWEHYQGDEMHRRASQIAQNLNPVKAITSGESPS
ncbi:MAG: hypothetical protein NXI04_23170 [Planctomycetaceae bacterium]|nr:hypothetical protein [Planctomycetaceae bacterium]